MTNRKSVGRVVTEGAGSRQPVSNTGLQHYGELIYLALWWKFDVWKSFDRVHFSKKWRIDRKILWCLWAGYRWPEKYPPVVFRFGIASKRCLAVILCWISYRPLLNLLRVNFHRVLVEFPYLRAARGKSQCWIGHVPIIIFYFIELTTYFIFPPHPHRSKRLYFIIF